MKIDLSKEEVLNQYPNLYNESMDKMLKKKNFDSNKNVDVFFDYCMIIDNTVQPMDSLENYLNHVKSKVSGCLVFKQGRLLVGSKLDNNNLPKKYTDIIESEYNEKVKKETSLSLKQKNLQSVLDKLGIKKTTEYNHNNFSVGNFYDLLNSLKKEEVDNRQHYLPSLDELSNVYPSVVEKYKNLANGDKLIVYDPENKESDEWGMCKYDISYLSKKDNSIRVHLASHSSTYELDTNNKVCYFLGFIDTKYVEKANLGEEFKGWKRTKQYRPTLEEQYSYIKGVIYTDGGINL